MTTFNTLAKPFVIQRPMLRRMSIANMLYPALIELVHSWFKVLQRQVLNIRKHLAPTKLHTISAKVFGGRISLVDELQKVDIIMERVHDLVSRQIFLICVSNKKPFGEDELQKDFDELLAMVFFKQPLLFWLQTPLEQIAEYVVEMITVLPKQPVDMNPRIRHYCLKALHTFASCPTLEEFLKTMKETDWVMKILLRNKWLRALVKRFEPELDTWQKREIYYNTLYNIAVIPGELVAAVSAERDAQNDVDRIELKMANMGYTGLSYISHTIVKHAHQRQLAQVKTSHGEKTWQPRNEDDDHHCLATRTNTRSNSRHRNHTHRRSSSRTRQRRSHSRRIITHRGGGTTDTVPVTIRQTHRVRDMKVSSELKELAHQHSEAVRRLEMANKDSLDLIEYFMNMTHVASSHHAVEIAHENARAIQRSYSPTFIHRLINPFMKSKTTTTDTTEQRRAVDNLQATRISAQERASRLLCTDRPTEAISVFKFSVLQHLAAIIAPLHISHEKWHNYIPFIALTYHLQTLDLLVPLSHIPHVRDDGYECRRVKKFPGLGHLDRQQECVKRGNTFRELMCIVFYKLVRLAKYPHSIVDTMNFGSQKDVQRYIDDVYQDIEWIKQTFLKTRKQSHPK